MLLNALYIFSFIFNLAFCLIISYAAKIKSTSSQNSLRKKFYLLSISLGIWSVIQYGFNAFNWINNTSGIENLIIASIIMSIWVAFFYMIFAYEMIGKKIGVLILIATLVSVCLATFIALISNIIIVDVIDNALTPNYNALAYSFTSIIPAILIVNGVFQLELFSFQNKKNNQIISKQSKYVSRGMIVTTLIVFTGNYVLDLLGISSDQIYIVVAFAPIIFAITVGYSVFSLKLFNFGAFFYKALTYIVTLGVVSVIYVMAMVWVARYAFNIELTLKTEIILGVLSIIVALSYQPLKERFNKLTSRIFYRDAYEIQDLLSEFNKTIISTIDLEQLLIKVSDIITRYIKAEYCEFAIRQNDTDTIRVIGPEGAKATKETVEQIRAYSKKYGKKIIVTDELDERDEDLKFILDKTEIGLLARITSDKKIEGIGYLILGFKKSGNPFSLQDKKATDIITNGLVVAIQNALQFEEIQLFNITLQQKVDDATKELKKTNEKLRALDETKDEFISMASHQLRTPLTSVKGYVSMVLEGDAGELKPTQKKMLKQAFFSSQRMVYLIADLLNVSRLKTGKFVIENKPTNLADVIAGEVDQLRETAEGKGLELIYKKPKNFPDLMLDETKIRQVIMNFADNAVHYTPSGGTVTLNLEHKPGVIEFTVVDNGLGVPKHDQHHLFSKFYRAKNAQKARPDGTGLGLFMAKKVIVAQGGSIIFSSEEGKGSVFGFAFAVDKLDALPKKQ